MRIHIKKAHLTCLPLDYVCEGPPDVVTDAGYEMSTNASGTEAGDSVGFECANGGVFATDTSQYGVHLTCLPGNRWDTDGVVFENCVDSNVIILLFAIHFA